MANDNPGAGTYVLTAEHMDTRDKDKVLHQYHRGDEVELDAEQAQRLTRAGSVCTKQQWDAQQAEAEQDAAEGEPDTGEPEDTEGDVPVPPADAAPQPVTSATAAARRAAARKAAGKH